MMSPEYDSDDNRKYEEDSNDKDDNDVDMDAGSGNVTPVGALSLTQQKDIPQPVDSKQMGFKEIAKLCFFETHSFYDKIKLLLGAK